MPKNKDLKRLARSRMKKTGESYTAARAELIKKSKQDFAERAGMSDRVVKAKTGRSWEEWVRLLDTRGARSMVHRDIADCLYREHGVPGWWAQMVTVGYERIRGLRERGQRRDGGYEASKSRTFGVPLARLYRAFDDRGQRNRWLGDARPTVRKAMPNRSMRITWEDGTSVEAHFTAKGPNKSQVAIQHRKLATKAAATAMKAYWEARLGALGEMFDDRGDTR
jgi:uncharacterized protein YndB with AHSA1/START domain